MRKIIILTALTAFLGCGGEPAKDPSSVNNAPVAPPPPTTASTGQKPAAPAADPFAMPPRPAEADVFAVADTGGGAIDVAPFQKVAKAKGIAPRPATCAAYEKRAAAKPAPADLATAVAEHDPAKRDAMLVALEAKNPDVVPALRADLAPIECADAITDKKIPASGNVTGPHANVIIGLSLAAKLARTAQSPPAAKDDDLKDKEKVKAFIKGPLAKWVVEQASAIESLSNVTVSLHGYGRGVAAVEAGNADLRLVDKIRSAPTPKSWDKELKAVYEAALDEGLEPRKNRGRDAALVGLSDLALVGSLTHPSVKNARGLLAKLYGGRRIDALDGLIVAAWSPPASDVSSYWGATLKLKGDGVGAPPKCTGAACADYARLRFEMGRTYWRRVDFIEAAYAAKEADDKGLLALSLTLAKGPNGAKEMMTAASPSALGLDHTEALDAVATGPALFDAAYLRALSVPDGDAAIPYLRDVAARYKKAGPLLSTPDEKKNAAQRADDAEAAAFAAEKKKS